MTNSIENIIQGINTAKAEQAAAKGQAVDLSGVTVSTNEESLWDKVKSLSLPVGWENTCPLELGIMADTAYRVAGVRSSRLTISDPVKEIGGMLAYLADPQAKNRKQRLEWLENYLKILNTLLEDRSGVGAVANRVRAFLKESPEEIALKYLRHCRGDIAKAEQLALTEGHTVPRWVFNKALQKLVSELFS